MQLLDAEIADCRALVIDGNPISRSTLVGMLRDWGVGLVAQAARPTDARKTLENRTFDIVLCEQHFDERGMGGQELLDELRRSQLLPYSTVFVMVTGEATYAKVAEAAESALDSYLLKPHNATTLGERLKQARRRKRILADIFLAIEEEDYETAADLCLQRFHSKGEYWLYAARIGAELLLRVGNHDKARELYEAVRETQALPWAKLGVARAYVEAGNTQQARRTLESLISANPSYADAYDVMGRVQIEQGELGAALETFRRACELTPGSVSRLQKQGMMAFYAGESAEAEKALDRATAIGISSKMYDLQTLVLLSFLKFDAADARGLARACDNLSHAVEKSPDSTRLRRFDEAVTVLRTLVDKQLAQVVVQIKDIMSQVRDDDFDFEAASNLISVLVRVLRNEIALPDGELWIQQIAERFCVSKAATDLLAASAQSVPAYVQVIRDVHASIGGMAEKAMTHSVRGSPEQAVRTLLSQGQQTLNAKLLELARLVLQRHQAKIAEAPSLREVIDNLHSSHCSKGTRVSINEHGRMAGAVALRA